jgi:nucleoside triphosphate pyrophosphatase
VADWPTEPADLETGGYRLVLASASPRRRELLRALQMPFVHAAATIDETLMARESPEDAVVRLAVGKACAVTAHDDVADLVLGADTLVVAGRDIIGKPADRADAARILRLLCGDRHRVLTGLALRETATGVVRSDVVTTWITMWPLSDREIRDYVESGASDGKAGAYAIQDASDRFVTSVEGSFTNVVGLPLERLVEMLSVWSSGRGAIP